MLSPSLSTSSADAIAAAELAAARAAAADTTGTAADAAPTAAAAVVVPTCVTRTHALSRFHLVPSPDIHLSCFDFQRCAHSLVDAYSFHPTYLLSNPVTNVGSTLKAQWDALAVQDDPKKAVLDAPSFDIITKKLGDENALLAISELYEEGHAAYNALVQSSSRAAEASAAAGVANLPTRIANDTLKMLLDRGEQYKVFVDSQTSDNKAAREAFFMMHLRVALRSKKIAWSMAMHTGKVKNEE